MNKILVISGAGRGLGKEIADRAMQDEGDLVISLSRTDGMDPENLKNNYLFVKTDLSEPFSDIIIELVRKQLKKDSIIYFFNNAAVISPINKTGGFNPDEIGYSIRVNVEFPVNLINSLLKNFPENKIVLVNISSGAAQNPVSHWALYCSAKAYMQMFFGVLGKENRENPRVEVHDIDPGVMDTGMQEEIRSREFPRQDYFRKLKAENGLALPADVAQRIFEEISYYS